MLLYCNGKKGFCDKEVCDKSCEYHDDTGAKYVKTEYERIKAMSPKDLGYFLCSLMNADDCRERCPASEYCYHGHNGMEKYLSSPAEEDE